MMPELHHVMSVIVPVARSNEHEFLP